ncbi:hypothetical protein GE061_016213 [Apolygus lucorum]|uniref:Uncharacterized protein n=1 Tax=Apolygus lucorum TaxID=248454 RepID=A0A6A4K4C3_APOLU|nr:hypothetical protein GE061_016213 [Apolygus lucorum]
MECDTSHSLIERKKKNYTTPIEYPRDWALLIRNTGKMKPFIVTDMDRNNVSDFANLFMKKLQLRTINNNNEPFPLGWLRFHRDQPGLLLYKTSMDENEEVKSICSLRNGRLVELTVPLKYSTRHPMFTEKKKDLVDLLPFVSPAYHQFYRKHPTSNSAANALDDTTENEEY